MAKYEVGDIVLNRFNDGEHVIKKIETKSEEFRAGQLIYEYDNGGYDFVETIDQSSDIMVIRREPNFSAEDAIKGKYKGEEENAPELSLRIKRVGLFSRDQVDFTIESDDPDIGRRIYVYDNDDWDFVSDIDLNGDFKKVPAMPEEKSIPKEKYIPKVGDIIKASSWEENISPVEVIAVGETRLIAKSLKDNRETVCLIGEWIWRKVEDLSISHRPNVDDIVKQEGWPEERYLKVTAVGQEYFLAKNKLDVEQSFPFFRNWIKVPETIQGIVYSCEKGELVLTITDETIEIPKGSKVTVTVENSESIPAS